MPEPVAVPDHSFILDTAMAAGVQFVVVVGDPPGGPLRLIVSRHPANLRALERTLGQLRASMRPSDDADAPLREDGVLGQDGTLGQDGALGSIPLVTPYGDVDLVFGGTGSTYADARSAGGTRRADGAVAGEPTVAWMPLLEAAARAAEGPDGPSARRPRRRGTPARGAGRDPGTSATAED